MNPEITVVITADYDVRNPQSVIQLGEVVAALAEQECRERADFILVESQSSPMASPNELRKVLPELEIVYAESNQARELKKQGVERSRVEWVALLDADCVPSPGWLRACLEARRNYEGACAVSGRTIYGSSGVVERILNVISRSYLESEGGGGCRHFTENNAVVSRTAYLEHAGDGRLPHASSLLSQSMLRAGEILAFEPSIVVTHAHDWSAEREIRRSLGFGMVRTRQIDRSVPYAWTVRLGPLSLPAVVAGRIVNSCWLCLKNGSTYGLAWYHQPLAFGVATFCCLMEVPSVARALRGDPPYDTAFR